MPNTFDANGLTVNSVSEIVSELVTNFQAIYGNDINVDSNSPDGQLINILSQAIANQLELLVQINTSFDPDRAIGTILDARCAINNVTRQGGTFTIQPIEIVTSTTVTLEGLDENFNDINGTGYTVQDNAGTQFILIDTTVLTAGTNTLNFRAQQMGAVETTIDTINTQVTIVLGVTSVNNPSAPLSIGQDQETDAQLRLRRSQSVSINSSGYLNGLLAYVLGIEGVIDAALYENVTNVEDGDGIPAHGIWLIVNGGANTDIGNAIYVKKSFGANMKGDVEIDITTANGSIFVAKFDRPVAEDLYISMGLQPTSNPVVFDEVAIKQYLVDNLTYNIGQYASSAEITIAALAAIAATGGTGIPVDVVVSSDGMSYVDYLETPTLGSEWTLSTARIDLNIIS